MTYKIYSEETLQSLPLPRIKEIAAQLGTKPVVDARFKKTWILVILRKQATLAAVNEPVEIIVADDDQTTVDDNLDAPDILTIDDSLVCGELGLTFRDPWAECTRRGHIEPSGSIVWEVYQDDRFIGCARRYYTAAGLFYTPDRLWDGTEYRTHYAAALAMLDAGDVEIARATVERSEDDRYIAAYIPAPNYLPSSDQFRVTNYSPKDCSEAAQLRQLLENGGRWFSVYSDGVVDDAAGISKGESHCIGHIQTSPGRYRVCVVGQKGGLFIDTLEGAFQALKLGWIEVQVTRTHKRLWSEYLGLSQLVCP